MRQRILVPLDGSGVGESALPCVRDLFAKISGETVKEVTLLHVLSPHYLSLPLGEESYEIYFNEQDYRALREKLIEYLNTTGESLRSAGITVNARVEVGEIPFQIATVAEEIKADMIVMSTHGHTGASQWALGSNTLKVLQLQTNIPITVVRPEQA